MSETTDWEVGVVAQTVSGEVVLRMTAAQADDLRDSLVWLTGDDAATTPADRAPGTAEGGGL